MIFFIHHIRKIIFGFSFLLALFIYLLISQSITSTYLQQVRLAQAFALSAVSFLYFALLASPLYSVFPSLPFKPIYIRARKAIGVSAFFFALIHATIAFFGLLGGIAGLSFLNSKYLLAIGLSFSALFILSLMAITSLEFLVKKLGHYWKTLHRFVYLAGIFIIIHALLLGSHFATLSDLIPRIFFIAVTFLLILEAIRLDKYLNQRFNLGFNFGISILIVIGTAGYLSFYLQPESDKQTSVSVHSQHIQLAKDAQNTSSNSLPNLPGLKGDKTKRYTVSFEHPDNILPGQEVKLIFKVYDASNGLPANIFERPYEKLYHLIVVDQNLKYFAHLHPSLEGSIFTITTSFPQASTYHIYSDFQPLGAIDQQIAVSLKVGDPETTNSFPEVDKNLTKIFGDFKVTLSSTEPLNAASMSLGQQRISFTLKDTKTNSAITNLRPYLGAFGHLVMVREESFDYLHVHPYNLTPVLTSATSGPTVDFLPIGIYGAFKPGIYRVWAQFNPAGNLFVADFTIKVN